MSNECVFYSKVGNICDRRRILTDERAIGDLKKLIHIGNWEDIVPSTR